jgi:hypothetical protein
MFAEARSISVMNWLNWKCSESCIPRVTFGRVYVSQCTELCTKPQKYRMHILLLGDDTVIGKAMPM